MRLITSQSKLEAEFTRLLRDHRALLWATAWAGVSSKLYQKLVAAQSKIDKLVVGLHFYQTHPDFIERFIGHKRVRFIKQTAGTFHPKLYLFYDSDDNWDLLIGSGNFTHEAFTTNTEAVFLISSDDDNAANVLADARTFINSCWKNSSRFSRPELDAYRKTRQNLKSKLNSLSGAYGAKVAKVAKGEKGAAKAQKPIFEVPVATMTWKAFVVRVQNDRYKSVYERLELLDRARALFNKASHFSALSGDERKLIAGLPNAIYEESGWFGSMVGNGLFHHRIAVNDTHISRALERIPLSGQLTRAHFEAFVEEYRKVFDGNFVATATRLLALKRPDTFVCFDAMNRRKLCTAFEIPQVRMDYDRYWDDIVERIQDSEWWLHPDPSTKLEKRISGARAAFLDSLYYDHPE